MRVAQYVENIPYSLETKSQNDGPCNNCSSLLINVFIYDIT